MKIYSTRLGEIEIQESDIIRFPYALPGFAGEKTFIMFGYEPESPFYILQSTVTPELTFVLADPFELFKDYKIKLEDETISELGLNEGSYPEIYVIVTVPADVRNMTANLMAPIVLNRDKKTAVQAILDKSGYTTRHRLFPPAGETETSGKESK